ncbi:hypothetical protein B0O99DRAFT_742437 [Bisporella sp. PMI_857]|nr:hypothetical protein B0O99DRAFT_742437 [Bisporella sp. PMI_857]
MMESSKRDTYPRCSEDEPFIYSDSTLRRQRTPWNTYLTALHYILTAILGLTCLGFFVHHQSVEVSSFEHGFKTELSYIFPAIKLETKTFHFLTSKEEGLQREFVGSRTPEIDHAWNRLLHSANLDLTDEEAGPELWNTTWKWEDTGYWFSGVSMWHQLHCLNFLREAVHWDTYDGPPGPPIQYHLDHCINYLRQVIMCYADMTPMRYDWDQGAGRLVLQDEPHTCRNYESIDDLARPLASCHNLDFSQPGGTGNYPKGTYPRGTCVRGPYFADY